MVVKAKEKKIGVAILTDTSTNQIIATRTYLKEQVSNQKELMRIVWEMAYDAVFKEKDTEGVFDILESLGFGLQTEDEVTKAINKIF